MSNFRRALTPLFCALSLSFAVSSAPNFAFAQSKPANKKMTPKPKAVEKTVGEEQNGSHIMLKNGEILVVRLPQNASTGYSRALIMFPEMPLRLLKYTAVAPRGNAKEPIVGAPQMSEWRFAVTGKADFERATWLKLVSLRPFEKGINDADLWEIKVKIPSAR